MINVDIYVPSLDEILDFQLDENVRISQLLNEISEMLCKKTKENLNEKPSDFILCVPGNERILPSNMTFGECGIKNGCRLLLV